MIVSEINAQPRLMIISQQIDALAPIAAVIRAILLQTPRLAQPHEAMTVAGQQAFDLIMIDLHCNRECITYVRSFKEHYPRVPLIAMVPYGDSEVVELALNHGADEYIAQPIAIDRLKTTLRNMLRMRSLMLQAGNVLPMHHPMAPLMDRSGGIRTLKEMEDEMIAHAVKSCDGCITQAARSLGIGRSTLYRKMQEKINTTPQISRENQTTRPMMAASSRDDS